MIEASKSCERWDFVAIIIIIIIGVIFGRGGEGGDCLLRYSVFAINVKLPAVSSNVHETIFSGCESTSRARRPIDLYESSWFNCRQDWESPGWKKNFENDPRASRDKSTIYFSRINRSECFFHDRFGHLVRSIGPCKSEKSWLTSARECLNKKEKKKSVERRINKYVAGYIGASVKRRERKKDVFNTHKCNVRSIYIYI